MICTRCEGTGFLNLEQLDLETLTAYGLTEDPQLILTWIETHPDHDVCMCDCCSDGESWYGLPGEHDRDNPNDPLDCR
jgi:hypothetical protein